MYHQATLDVHEDKAFNPSQTKIAIKPPLEPITMLGVLIKVGNSFKICTWFLLKSVFFSRYLRQFDFAFYTYMIVFAYEVPSPKKVVGFSQLILPFKPLVWYLTSKYWKKLFINFTYISTFQFFSRSCDSSLDSLCFAFKTLSCQP